MSVWCLASKKPLTEHKTRQGMLHKHVAALMLTGCRPLMLDQADHSPMKHVHTPSEPAAAMLRQT